MQRTRLRNLVLAAVMAALVSAVAPIRFFVPGVPTVPVTLQVLVVLLAGGLLRPAWGAAAMGLYLLLGAAGLPVFAGGMGGLQVLVGPTAGYLWSWPLAAAAVGALAPAQRSPGLRRPGLAMSDGLGRPGLAMSDGLGRPGLAMPAGLLRTSLAMLAGLLLTYLGGAGFAVLVGGKGLAAVLSGWVLPFVPFDLAKVVLAAAASTAINRALARAGLQQTA